MKKTIQRYCPFNLQTQSPNSSKDQVIPLVLAQTKHKEPQLRLTSADHNFHNGYGHAGFS
jgi:hypothetical protein